MNYSVKNSNTSILSDDLNSILVNKLKNTFSEDEQKIYIANLHMYLHFDQTKDFPIDLENVWGFLGFANKGNAKSALENNFVLNEDYKKQKDEKTVLRTENGFFSSETILLNIDTFKNLCMLVKTESGKKIRKYYTKLESIYNEIIKEELEKEKLEQDKIQKELEFKNQQLEEKDNIIREMENRPDTNGFNNKQKGYVYLVHDTDKKGHFKIGMTNDINKRISGLNGSSSTYSLIMTKYWETFDKFSAEKICHMILDPFKIKTRCEWFYVKNDKELAFLIDTINKCLDFINTYEFKDSFDFNDKIKDVNVEIIKEINLTNTNTQTLESSKNKQNAQNLKARTGLYKGVCFNNEKKKWDAHLKYDGISNFLGRFDTEELAGIAYNDFALYMNNKHKDCNYSINDIPGYIQNPRNIPEENKVLNYNKKTSKYYGVCYLEKRKKYRASIKYNNKNYILGEYEKEEDGAKIYNKQALYFNNKFKTDYVLNNIDNYETIEENIIDKLKEESKMKIENQSSKYSGVTFSKQAKKWFAIIVYNKKQYHLGSFDNDISAAKKYNEKAIEFNNILESENKKRRYKLNIFD